MMETVIELAKSWTIMLYISITHRTMRMPSEGPDLSGLLLGCRKLVAYREALKQALQ